MYPKYSEPAHYYYYIITSDLNVNSWMVIYLHLKLQGTILSVQLAEQVAICLKNLKFGHKS